MIRVAIRSASEYTMPSRTADNGVTLRSVTVAVTETSPTLGRFFPSALPGASAPCAILILPTSQDLPTEESTAKIFLSACTLFICLMADLRLSAVTGRSKVPYTKALALRSISICPTIGPRQSPVTRSEPMHRTTGLCPRQTNAQSNAAKESGTCKTLNFISRIIDARAPRYTDEQVYKIKFWIKITHAKGETHMSWVDIAIIAVLALFAIIGVVKGIKKSSLSLAAFLISFIAAFFLAKVVTEALLNIEAIKDIVMGTTGKASLYNWLLSSISAAEPSEFIFKNFYQPVLEIIGKYTFTESFTLTQGVALYYSFSIATVVVGIVLFILVRIVMSIICMIIKSYFGKKKSGLSRLGGMVVGAVRGAAWTFAVVIIFTFVSGFTFLAPINVVETELEKSVIGKYVNQYSFVVKNKFLPDYEQFDRIVNASGLAVKEGDVEENDGLVGGQLEIYIDLLTLNYTSGGYTVDAKDKPILIENSIAIDPALYSDSGFDQAVRAINEYNIQAAEFVLNGGIANASAAALSFYVNTIQEANDSIYNRTNELLTALANYEKAVEDAHALQSPDSELIEETNRDLQSKYNGVKSIFEKLDDLYSSLTLFPEFTVTMPGAVTL